MTVAEEALKQLDALLAEYNRMAEASGTVGRPSKEELTMTARLLAAIERLTEPGSSYAREAEQLRTFTSFGKVYRLATLAVALRDDIRDGYTNSVIELAHADTHDGYLAMAAELQAKGYKDPAAVVAGTSLEVHLRSLAAKHGITVNDSNGHPKKTAVLNADLRKAGVYNGLEEKQLTAWLAIRNSAAHGNYGDYDHGAVKQLIDGVRGFAVRHPA